MSRQSTWTNADGLVIGYGTHTVDNTVPAVTADNGGAKVMTFLIKATDLVATASVVAGTQAPQSAVIRRGAYINRAKFEVTTAFATSASGTLTIGTFKAGAAGTVDDADGVDATIAVTAIDAVGEIVICDGALVNGTVPVGATSDSDVVVIPSYGTGVFTAGEGILTIEYVEPAYKATVAA